MKNTNLKYQNLSTNTIQKLEPRLKFLADDRRTDRKQEAQGPHRSPESFWLLFLIKTHAKLFFFIVAPTALEP
jgi:hypothetical protein